MRTRIQPGQNTAQKQLDCQPTSQASTQSVSQSGSQAGSQSARHEVGGWFS